MGVIASYETEGIIYGKYILQHMTDAKIGVSYQNDDLGKDYFKGLQEEVSTTFRPLHIASRLSASMLRELGVAV